MAAKIIRKEGKKLIIEITIDLEDSMLDSEEAIQAVVNEAGTLATEEALKQFDTNGEAIEIEGNQWRSKGQEENFTKRRMAKFSVRGMFITTTDAERPSAL